MNRMIVSVFLVFATLIFLGTALSSYAQTRPDVIGAEPPLCWNPCPDLSGTWEGTLNRISYCTLYNALTPLPPATPTYATRWAQFTTTIYQESGSCFFTAFRTITLQSDNNGPPYVPPGANTWFTGTITQCGSKISMQALPSSNGPPYTLYGDIVKDDFRNMMPTEIRFVINAGTGNMGTWDISPKCANTSRGTMQRQ
jgi:hypothetical protein